MKLDLADSLLYLKETKLLLTVLMSIYEKEQPSHFKEAMRSIWENQTCKPNEIVLVIDGPINLDLQLEIDHWEKLIGSNFKQVVLSKNVGLGEALKIGYSYCSGEFIARMDTDDVSMPMRFERQINYLKKYPKVDVLGTYISEMNERGELTRSKVEYPIFHEDMFLFFKKRDPLPHVTAMFRRRFFDKTGGYSGKIRMAEDTLLWLQGFKNGCVFANLPEVGVAVRQSDLFFKRRADFKKSLGLLWFRLTILNRELNYNSTADIFACLYFMLSISPNFVKRFAYKFMR